MIDNKFVWQPPEDFSAKSNIRRFMAKHAITTYEELIKRSTDDIAWFWQAVSEDIGIEWSKDYTEVIDDSAGIAWTKWFINGELNLAHNCLDRHAHSSRRNKLACIWEGDDGSVQKLSYWDLYVATNRLANGLKAFGINKGDRVGIFMPMIPETVIALLACVKVGAIFTPIFSGFGFEAVASRLNDSEAKLLITSDGFLRRGAKIEMKPIADKAVEKCPTVTNVIVARRLGQDVPMTRGRDVYWEDVVSGQPNSCLTVPVDSEHPFMIIHTSGTTGKPKGAVHTHAGFLIKVSAEVAYQFDLKDEDILFWVTDIGWIMGPWEVFGATALGGTIFIYEGTIDWPQPDRLWSLIDKHGVTIFGISPTAIRSLMKHGKTVFKNYDLSTLRIIGSTGETWNRDPWQWCFDNVGKGRCPIINISGGTEVGACFLSPLPIQPLKPCSLGGPAPGMAINVFDSEGHILPNGIGELVATKPWPSMTRGIWRDPERFLETYWSRWPGVWVHGDWASIDEDGYWFLHGRSDDTIKISGKRIGPAEIESALVEHPAVLEAAAIGAPHEIKGESVVCFVVLKDAFPATNELNEELKAQVADRLGKPLTPEVIRVVRELPKTRNGKILRRLMKAKYVYNENPSDIQALENPQALEEFGW